MSFNLIGASYVWAGEQLDKETYQQRKQALTRAQIQKYRQQFEKLENSTLHNQRTMVNCEECFG